MLSLHTIFDRVIATEAAGEICTDQLCKRNKLHQNQLY